VLDTGQMDWAGWKPVQLLMACSCSMGKAAANSRARHRKAQTVAIFLNLSFSTLSSPYPHNSLCTCLEEKGGSMELLFLSARGPSHPNSFPHQTLLPTLLAKRGNLCSFANEASTKTVTRAGFFQPRRVCTSYVQW